MRRRPSPQSVLAIASLGTAAAFADATIVNIAFPNIARSFLARRHGEGPIIAVDVKAAFERSKVSPAAAPVRDDRPPRPPRLGETITRVLLLGSENTTEAARRHADLLIKPRAEGVGLLEFHQLDTAREAGRVAAREALEQAPPRWFA